MPRGGVPAAGSSVADGHRASAPIVDLRGAAVDVGGLTGLAPWQWCVEYVRRFVADAGDAIGTARRGRDQGLRLHVRQRPAPARPGARRPRRRTRRGLLRMVADGRAGGVSDILGVDAMDVPPPDRKGSGLAEGHAVVALGYGRHAAFPGGGYLIVRNPWADVGWGDRGDGYLPFTYLRRLRDRPADVPPRREGRPGEPSSRRRRPEATRPGRRRRRRRLDAVRRAPALPSGPIDRLISQRARCADPRSSYTELFFSENPMDIVRAKAICAKCTVRELCLAGALERGEPYGVWGGEFLYEGRWWRTSVAGAARGSYRCRPSSTKSPGCRSSPRVSDGNHSPCRRCEHRSTAGTDG